MKLELKTTYITAILSIECGNTKIEEDLAINSKIDESEIEQAITLASDMCRYNGMSDIEFATMIFDNFLNDQEQYDFIELITAKYHNS